MYAVWYFCVIFLMICHSIKKISTLNTTNITCDDVANSTYFGKLERSLSSSKPLENLKVKFYLFTNSNRNETELDSEILKSLIFNSVNTHAKTIIIIHGYMSDGLEPWILEMKEKLLNRVCNS